MIYNKNGIVRLPNRISKGKDDCKDSPRPPSAELIILDYDSQDFSDISKIEAAAAGEVASSEKPSEADFTPLNCI